MTTVYGLTILKRTRGVYLFILTRREYVQTHVYYIWHIGGNHVYAPSNEPCGGGWSGGGLVSLEPYRLECERERVSGQSHLIANTSRFVSLTVSDLYYCENFREKYTKYTNIYMCVFGLLVENIFPMRSALRICLRGDEPKYILELIFTE